MKISIAKTAGFCMGVRRAVDMVLDAANLSDEPIYTYGPLIHNPQVLEMLEGKNIHRLDTIPKTGRGVVLIRAHGVPPKDEKALSDAGFTVINATCPRVVRVQVIINKFAKKGYATIIVGDKKHPEVVGLLGYARDQGHTITRLEQLATLPIFEKAVVVAQTTQNTGFYDEIKAWCSTHAPHYEIFDTICGSTEKRQDEVRKLARSHDAVIVVGGKQSGNTKRLAQVARETGTLATHIEDACDIEYSFLSHAKSIAITAGASTPNWIIKETCYGVDQAMQQQQPVKAALFRTLNFLLQTNVLLAAGAGCLTFGAAAIQGGDRTMIHAVIAMAYVLSMQIMNNIITIGADTYNRPYRAAFYKKHHVILKLLALMSGGLGLYLAWTLGPLCFAILMAMSLLGFSYNRNIIPLWIKSRVHRIKDIPGSKTILIAVAWGVVTSLLPALTGRVPVALAVIAFFFSTGLVFARTVFVDVLAIQGDRISGKETLPILLGAKKSFAYIQGTLGATALLPVAGFFAAPWGNAMFFLALVPLFMLVLLKLYKEDSFLSVSPYEVLFESSFVMTGLVALML
jgi:4-hydroxy-3-methylbut-2-enyl diphosphate reductase